MKLVPGSLSIVNYRDSTGTWGERHISTMSVMECQAFIQRNKPEVVAPVLKHMADESHGLERSADIIDDLQAEVTRLSETVREKDQALMELKLKCDVLEGDVARLSIARPKTVFQSRGPGLAGFGPVGERADYTPEEDLNVTHRERSPGEVTLREAFRPEDVPTGAGALVRKTFGLAESDAPAFDPAFQEPDVEDVLSEQKPLSKGGLTKLIDEGPDGQG